MDQSCYPFAAGTPGMGVCRSGVASCINNVLGPCVGAVGPSQEACNNLDDDCNGLTDDGLGTATCGLGTCQVTVSNCVNGVAQTCKPGQPTQEVCNNNLDDDCDGVVDDGCTCIHVAPTGSDSASGDETNPVRHLAVAQNLAADAGIHSICVAADAFTGFDYGGDAGETLVMRDGISVLGGYSSSNWLRSTTNVTRLTARTPEGVLFDSQVTSPTVLDQFTVVGGDFPTSAAITVRGSTGASIHACKVTGGSGPSVVTSVGIDVVDAGAQQATPVVSRSSVSGGGAAVDGGSSIGLRSFGSAPFITQNCEQSDSDGRCIADCTAGTAGTAPLLSIRGATGFGGAVYTGRAIAVLLDTSPNAVVDSSAVCGVMGSVGVADTAAVRVEGDARGVVVRSSNLNAMTGTRNVAAVWLAPCGGAAPWLFENYSLLAASGSPGAHTDGVHAVGDCHPVIDSNLTITGCPNGGGQDCTGVYCAFDPVSGIGSRCAVLGNTLIRGSWGGFPPSAVGLRCDEGACARIEDNGQISGNGGAFSAGVLVTRSGPLIARNIISAGCGRVRSVGLGSDDAYPRVENNVIFGLTASVASTCLSGSAAPQATAVAVQSSSSLNELDLHSNSLFGSYGFGTYTCVSRALSFDVSDAGSPAGPLGLVRNNVLWAGDCSTKRDVEELDPAADPRVLLNNWFQTTGTNSIVMYRDEASTDVFDAGTINGFTDITAGDNITGACLSPNAYHLVATSVCRNTGTDAGAPADDLDGDARPQEGAFDIGADEYVP